MRTVRARSVVVYALAAICVAGLIFFVVEIFSNGGTWSTSYINKHIYKDGKLTTAGKIMDREGVVLAQSKDAQRIYNSDMNTRTAMLHTVGDTANAISTSVQNVYRDELVGYNPITGLSLNEAVGYGNNIKLTLDSDICAAVYKAMANRHGSALLYNYKTGEVLCMVSTPSFDPENPPTSDEINSNLDTYDGVYVNRGLSSSLTPGSIFKIFTSAAAIENIPDIFSRTFVCKGSLDVEGDTITCMSHHGKISFEEGLSESCNIVFAELAMELGKDKMTYEATKMGCNKNLSLDRITLAQTHYDVKNASKSDLAWSGIGQYTDTVNPMHMLMFMGAIANDGVPVVPYMVEKVSTVFGIPLQQGFGKTGERMLSDNTANKLKEMMRYTVKNNYGDSMFPGLSVCAKTGTGETSKNEEPNAWMIGFSEDEDCPLAFVVVVEHGGYGSRAAGPIAKTMMKMGADLVRKTK